MGSTTISIYDLIIMRNKWDQSRFLSFLSGGSSSWKGPCSSVILLWERLTRVWHHNRPFVQTAGMLVLPDVLERPSQIVIELSFVLFQFSVSFQKSNGSSEVLLFLRVVAVSAEESQQSTQRDQQVKERILRGDLQKDPQLIEGQVQAQMLDVVIRQQQNGSWIPFVSLLHTRESVQISSEVMFSASQ